MSLQLFSSSIDFGSLYKDGKKGTGNAVWLEPKEGCVNTFRGPSNLIQTFPIRPSGAGSTVDEKTKFEIHLAVDAVAHSGFIEAAKKFDDWTIDHVFANKSVYMPSRATYIADKSGLLPLFGAGKFLKTGGNKRDGGKYDDVLRLKIQGKWNKYVSEVVMRQGIAKSGGTVSWPDYCKWLPRTEVLDKDETRFYIWVKTDAEGKDVYVDKVFEKDGSWRLVGPQDCRPGHEFTPVFSPSCIYFMDGFGLSITARALFIKPRDTAAGDRVEQSLLPPGFVIQTEEFHAVTSDTGKRGREEDSADAGSKRPGFPHT